MLRNSIQLALRKLKQQLLLSLLKIGGLAISIGAAMLLLLYINFQWQYDQFHKNGDRIYRLQTDQYQDGLLTISSALTYAGVGPLMKATFSGVENQVRLGKWIANDMVLQYQDHATRSDHFYFVEPSFLELFSFELIKGDPVTALAEPNSVVLTEAVARKLFGTVDPMGQQVTMESRKPLKVTGIAKNPPIQSHLDFEILVSYSTLEAIGFGEESVYGGNNFDWFYTYTYVLLNPKADPVILASQLTEIIQERKKDSLIKDIFSFQPLPEIHLYSNLQYELQATGNGKNIWIILGISLLILILAWANYFNISTAGTLDQSKSIGIRKVIGASQKQIIGQLCIEHLIYTTMGLLIGIILAVCLMPVIEYYFNIQLSMASIFQFTRFNPLAITLVLIIIGTIFSSLLPALVMSAIRPIQIFSKSFNLSSPGLNVRKVLILFQFTIIISLLAGSIAIWRQINFMQDKDTGTDLSNIMIVKGPLGTSSYKNLNSALIKFKNELNTMSLVSSIAISKQIPGNSLELVHDVSMEGVDEYVSINRNYGTTGFFKTYQLRFLAGGVPKVAKMNNVGIVINEAAMHLLGYQEPSKILTKQITFWEKNYMIIGVIENYHHLSLHHPVVPLIYNISTRGDMEDGYFSIKMTQSNYQNSIAQINKAFTSSFPNTVFEYFDMEEHFHHQYKTDNDFKKLNFAFTGLALFISCIGLFGLSTIIMKKRFKEIAIRKVLGASVKGIVALLSMQFIKLILLGWIIAIPITWYGLTSWLQNFPYRISIQWWIYLVALGLALTITLLTTGINSIIAARSNPLKPLRSE